MLASIGILGEIVSETNDEPSCMLNRRIESLPSLRQRTTYVLSALLCVFIFYLTYAMDAAYGEPVITATLTCVVVDGAAGDTLAARCRVSDAYSIVYYPPPGTVFHYTWKGGFFYTDGVFSIDLPPGEFRFRIGH